MVIVSFAPMMRLLLTETFFLMSVQPVTAPAVIIAAVVLTLLPRNLRLFIGLNFDDIFVSPKKWPKIAQITKFILCDNPFVVKANFQALFDIWLADFYLLSF